MPLSPADDQAIDRVVDLLRPEARLEKLLVLGLELLRYAP